jgi:hypothetical protein
LRQKLILRQVAFDPMLFGARRIQDQDRRGPDRIEPIEPRRMFFDVRLDREKIRVDKARNPFIRVRLGFQPSTSASRRSRAEIE